MKTTKYCYWTVILVIIEITGLNVYNFINFEYTLCH